MKNSFLRIAIALSSIVLLDVSVSYAKSATCQLKSTSGGGLGSRTYKVTTYSTDKCRVFCEGREITKSQGTAQKSATLTCTMGGSTVYKRVGARTAAQLFSSSCVKVREMEGKYRFRERRGFISSQKGIPASILSKGKVSATLACNASSAGKVYATESNLGHMP
jgi:hypothetical protein